MIALEIISIHWYIHCIFIVQFTFPILAGSLKTIPPPIITHFYEHEQLDSGKNGDIKPKKILK